MTSAAAVDGRRPQYTVKCLVRGTRAAAYPQPAGGLLLRARYRVATACSIRSGIAGSGSAWYSSGR